MPLIKEAFSSSTATGRATTATTTTATASAASTSKSRTRTTTTIPSINSRRKRNTHHNNKNNNNNNSNKKNNNNNNHNNNNNIPLGYEMKKPQNAGTKIVPVTPIQSKSSMNFVPSTSSRNDGSTPNAAFADALSDDDDDDDDDEQEEEEEEIDVEGNGEGDDEFMPHTYPNFYHHHHHSHHHNADHSDDNLSKEFDLDEDSSSLAMITPPPPYDTPHLPMSAKRASSTAPSRKFLFQNREIFNISVNNPVAPNASFVSAITPTKLSAAAAAMFAAPQMAQLNRKWSNLHRKRRRRNSSSGDSKELDKLVLQSVDWDENEMY